MVLAAGVSIVDLAAGRVEDFLPAPTPGAEVRHIDLVGHGLLAGQVREVAPDHPDAAGAPAYVQDTPRTRFVPAPPAFAKIGSGGLCPVEGVGADAVHALSVMADPVHGEIVLALAGRDRLAVVDAAEGSLRRIVDLAPFGCISPSGLGILSATHYVVAGHERGIFVMERGTHRYARDLSLPDVALSGHSHLATVPG